MGTVSIVCAIRRRTSILFATQVSLGEFGFYLHGCDITLIVMLSSFPDVCLTGCLRFLFAWMPLRSIEESLFFCDTNVVRVLSFVFG